MRVDPRVRALLIAAAVSIGNLFLHKPISNVCDALFAALGRSWYERIAIAGIGALSAAAALPGARRRLRELGRAPLLPAVAATALLTIAAQHWLLVSNIELIHFPQFALIAALLLAAGLDPASAWLAATVAGVLDETYQHLVIYAGVAGTYFDYNDIVLNALGASWGTLLFARAAAPPRRAFLIGAALLLAAAVAVLVVWPPQLSPLLVRAATGRLYRVLSPGEGLLGVWLAAAVVVAAQPRAGGART